MNKKIAIPTDFEAINNKWLNEALRSTGTINDARVDSFRIETMKAGPGQTGQLARLLIEYSQNEENAPETLIAKLSSKDPKVRATLLKSRNYEKEVRFYQELATETNLSTPKCYCGDIDLETGYCVLLLEDLSHYRAVEISTGCNFEEAELVIRSLAKFHASWWEKSQIHDIDYITPINQLADYKQKQYQDWWSKFPQKLETALPDYQLPQTFLELGQQFGNNLSKVFTEFS